MTQRPTSGWENPDHHVGIEKRARPMFDAAGNQVDSAPPAEDLTPAEHAMFAAMEAGADRATAVATGVIVGEAAQAPFKPGDVVTGANMNPIPIPASRVARIRELATTALDNPMPASWAMALGEILRELDA